MFLCLKVSQLLKVIVSPRAISKFGSWMKARNGVYTLHSKLPAIPSIGRMDLQYLDPSPIADLFFSARDMLQMTRARLVKSGCHHDRPVARYVHALVSRGARIGLIESAGPRSRTDFFDVCLI